MVKHFDHVTIVVKDLDNARRFFVLLGFEQDQSVVISGPQFSRYMRVDGIEAEHCTLALPHSAPRLEVQLLRFRHPAPIANADLTTLRQLGFNHICFAVDDIEAEVSRLRANGIRTLNDVMDFHDRTLVFLAGPEGITVELAQWHS
jgi:catechol 2,3-dioxygenase-like lactoylglutathione lyase family enzyme